MSNHQIACPKCGEKIELSGILRDQITAELRVQFDNDREKQVKDECRKIEEKFALQTQSLEKELAEKRNAVLDFQRRQLDLQAQKRKLDEDREALQYTLEQQLEEQKKKLREEEQRKAAQEYNQKSKLLEDELNLKNEKLSAMQQQELELRKQQRELQESKQAMQLDMQRQLDEERKKIEQDAVEKLQLQHQLKEEQNQNIINSLNKKITDLQIQITTGSQQRQGQALQTNFHESLEAAFPTDKFEDVRSGERGADLIQIVCDHLGRSYGTILWELKNTKNFQQAWVEKLKQDQQAVGADVAVILTMAMPKDAEQFIYQNGVWITEHCAAFCLCVALREMCISVRREKAITSRQEDMKDILYQYITGKDFTYRVNQIITAYTQMQSELQAEKKAMQKIWKGREKQIGLILNNIDTMKTEIEHLTHDHATLPNPGLLELEAIVETAG